MVQSRSVTEEGPDPGLRALAERASLGATVGGAKARSHDEVRRLETLKFWSHPQVVNQIKQEESMGQVSRGKTATENEHSSPEL